MRLSIDKYCLVLFLSLSSICQGQDDNLGLTDTQYDLFSEGHKKSWREPKEAIILFDSLIKMKPDFCLGYTYLGNAYQRLENTKLAKKFYKEAINCDPTMRGSYHSLSSIYEKNEQYDSAEYFIFEWMKYEEYDSDSLRTEYYKLGEIAQIKNQYHKSIEYLTEALKRCNKGEEYNSFCGYIYYTRSEYYLVMGEGIKAYEDIVIFEKLNPEDKSVLVLKGEILQQLERFEESNTVLIEYLTNPTNKGENWVNFMIGYNYNRLKEFEKSCFYLREAERLGYEDIVLSKLLEDCKP